jgi:hypothetical protein
VGSAHADALLERVGGKPAHPTRLRTLLSRFPRRTLPKTIRVTSLVGAGM